ncbi:MAG: protein tyrosine phosphatase [Pseudomonadota bacterium]
MGDIPINVLFVCSRNQWRSPTAEHVWRNEPGINVRSAGTASSARRRIGLADVQWSDLILVMEEKHKSRIKAEFRQAAAHKRIEVLDIPDEYGFLDEELIEILREKCATLFEGDASEID